MAIWIKIKLNAFCRNNILLKNKNSTIYEQGKNGVDYSVADSHYAQWWYHASYSGSDGVYYRGIDFHW